MAWWTGQPVYGSNPVSKFVRENFAYLKTETDGNTVSINTQAALIAALSTSVGSVHTVLDSGNATTNTAALTAAVAAGGAIEIASPISGHFDINNEILVVHAGTHIFSYNQIEIHQNTAARRCFLITVSNVTIEGLKLLGTQHAAPNANEVAILANGTDNINRITDITVCNCEIHNWGSEGVRFNYVNRPKAYKNYIYDTMYTGIQGRHVNDIDFSFNIIKDIEPDTTLAVGIAVTGTVSQATSPKRGAIHGNNISNIPFEGILLEPGEHITITGNTVVDCFIPIAIAPHAVPGGGVSRYNTVTGNTIVNLTLAAMAQRKCAIYLGGADAANHGIANVVDGNTIIGYGTNVPFGYGAIHAVWETGSIISGNTLNDSYVIGINLLEGFYGGLVTSNNINSMVAGATAGINVVNGSSDYTLIDSNNINSGDGHGIQVLTNNPLLWIGKNKIINTSVHQQYVGAFTVNEALHKEMTLVTLTGTVVATVLKTITIPGGSMGRHGHIKLKSWGSKAGVNGTKAITFSWGGTNIAVVAANNDIFDWRLEADISSVNLTNSQIVSWACWNGTVITQGTEYLNENTLADVVLNISGQLGNINDQIDCAGWTVERD